MVNGLLAVVIRQFDPGPSSPLALELSGLLEKHRKIAEASGDAETLASVTFLQSQLEPYVDLSEGDVRITENDDRGNIGDSDQGTADRVECREDSHMNLTNHTDEPAEARMEGSAERKGKASNRSLNWEDAYALADADQPYDFDAYGVPAICHETPMAYVPLLNAWRCSVCGTVYALTRRSVDTPLPGGHLPSFHRIPKDAAVRTGQSPVCS
jgi:rubredoxin